jgi:hypothetical protein
VLSRAIASQSFEDTARTLSRMEALVEPHRSSLLWEFGAQVGVGTSGDVAERVFARELDAPSALHASRGALKARTSKAPVDEEMRDWPRLSSMLLHPADGPRLTAALQGVAPLWRVPRPLLRERLERRPSGHWERPLLAACLGASIHAQGGWAALASAAPNLDAELADSLWFGAARRVSSASSLSIQEILDSARRPPPGAHVGGYLAGLAFSFSERQEVARNPGRWLDEVGARLDGGASLLFSGAVGRASTRLLWRSTHALATVVGEHTDDARREAVCEAMGQGVAGSAKTLTDLLRWRIDWDRFAGPGCDRAFDTGMRDVLAREYLRLPEHYARLARTLDLKEEGDAL